MARWRDGESADFTGYSTSLHSPLQASAVSITKSALDTGISASTMYIIVIPIGFLLLAIIGAFIIKFVFHDLAECRYLPCCVSSDKAHDNDCENAAMDDPELQRQPVAGRSGTTNRTSANSGMPLDQDTVNSLLERASQSKFGVSRTHVPTSSAHPTETECFLPAVMDNCPPDYSHYARHHRQSVRYKLMIPLITLSHTQAPDHEVSPPPSYKSSDASTPPADLIAATAHRRQFF